MTRGAALAFSAELKNLAAIRHFVQETAATLQADPNALHDVILAVDEMAANVMVHGYQGGPGTVEVGGGRGGGGVVLCVRAHPPPFDPALHPMPDVTLPL